MNLEQGLDLAVKALIKTLDTASPSPNKSLFFFIIFTCILI